VNEQEAAGKVTDVQTGQVGTGVANGLWLDEALRYRRCCSLWIDQMRVDLHRTGNTNTVSE
jgi:hypothetical protein